MAFMALALAAGSVSAWMVVRYVARHSASGAPVAVSSVVVAAGDISAASKLTPDLLKVVDWPSSALPQGAFDKVDGLDGRITSASLVAGEPILEGRLGAKGSSPGMASLIPPNMRAMTVPVNEVVGVGGFIHPGDLVDVITTMQAPLSPSSGAGMGEYRSKIVLQNIRVLAAGQQLAAEGSKPETVQAVTLLVSPEEAERLALASTQGKLQLTMRAHSDTGSADTPGVSPRELLEVASPAAQPTPAEAAHDPHPHHHVVKAAASAAAPASPVEVVEVLRGDRVEQRKVSAETKSSSGKAAP